MASKDNVLSDAIRDSLISNDVPSVSYGSANIVDVMAFIGGRISKLAEAITPQCAGNSDAYGGHVESLTEAVMGVTGGLCSIAEAIESLADAVSSLKPRVADPLDMLDEELRRELDKE